MATKVKKHLETIKTKIMTFPLDLKYTEEHEWIKIGDEHTALIGITDHAQSELGDIVYVEVDTVDEELEKGEVFGIVEAVKTTSDLFMPISGKILEFNPEIDETEGDNPGLINSDPYGKGWIVKIKITNEEELKELMTVEQYQSLVG